MKKHELYIDGVEINLPDDFDFAMLYQSWFFQDITSIASNRTYTVKVPLTPQNIRTIGYSSYEDVVSDYQYKKHTVDYYRNGFWIIRNGMAVITSIDSNINFVFVWGTVPNFKLMADDSLRDLDDGSYYDWNSSSSLLTTDTDFGLYKIDFGQGIQDIQYINPSVKASHILDRIKAKYGITIDLPEAQKYILPCLTMNGGICNKDESRCDIYTSGIDLSGTTNEEYFKIESYTAPNRNIYDVIIIKKAGKVTITPAFYFVHDKCEYYFDDVKQGELTGEYSHTTPEGLTLYKYSTPVTFTVSNPGVRFTIQSIAMSPIIADSKSFTLDILPDEYAFGSRYSIFANLPDMGVVDFIKAIMFCENVFAYPDEKDNTIVHFESVDTLIENKAGAVNWTHRLVNEMPAFSKPANSEYNFNSMAKKNRLMWTNDDDGDATPDFSGYLIVQNETIDDKKDLLTIPTFQGTEEKDGLAYIPLYDTDGKIQSVTPRLLAIQVKNGVAQGRFAEQGNNLSFSASDGIIARKYSGYQSLVLRPRYLKVNCVLTDLDLYNLKLDVPVYFEQFGAYYGIIKVQVKKNNLCACEFLKLST